jgi:tRNA A-37 threonylcarbamoyl transferase component Bud32
MPETGPPHVAVVNDSAAALLAVVDAYLADLRAGKSPDRAAVLASHPELAPRLESCLAALDFIHRAERPDPAVPPILGDFRVVREIGRGAMGVVYEAEQVSLKRRVALKVLRFGGAVDAEAMERFRREAETVARLHHTNIVPIFAVACEGGVHFFAMQLIEGRSLAAELAQAKAQGRPLDARAVAGWGVQAAEALAHAHARGVVHRDVKPSNLLLDGEGVVWLTDFGLARRSDEATLTVAGAVLGTPLYMSPEQAAALDRPVDQRSDVYSLGATLYELATGRPVFEAPLAKQLLEQIATAEPAAPRRVRPDLPPDLETVLLKCLVKEPGQRYGTAKELADDLRRVVSGDPVKARRPGLLLRLRRWVGRRRKQAPLVAGVAAVAVVATLALGVTGLYWRHAATEARKGSVTLQLEGGLARGEILDADGKPAVPPFTLPSLAPIELTGGSYRLRVTQPGRLSEDYELFVEQGQHYTFTVGCNDRQLWEPTPMPENNWEFEKLSGVVPVESGALHISSECPDRWFTIDAVTIKRLGKAEARPFVPQDVWKLRLTPQDPALAPLRADTWRRLSHDLMSFVPVLPSRFGAVERQVGEMIQPAPDLDGDGVGDFVFVCGQRLLAVSGKEGKVLWCRELYSKAFPPGKASTWFFLTTTEQEMLVALSLAQAIPGVVVPVPPSLSVESHTQQAGPPLVVADIDGDGHPDLIFAHSAYVFQNQGEFGNERHRWQGVLRPCVEAVSGRTGKTLWRHELPFAEALVLFRKSPYREEILKGDYRPLMGYYRYADNPVPISEFASLTERQTEQGRILLAGLYNEVVRLDLRNGRQVAPPTPLLTEPPEPPRNRREDRQEEDWTQNPQFVSVAAWSADGKIAFVRKVDPRGPHGAPRRGDIFRGISAIDTSSGQVLYSVAQNHPNVFADLDGDGVPDIITASEVFDGATGNLRWRAGFSEEYGYMDDRRQHDQDGEAALPCPDFDGDGYCDVFSAMVVDGERFGQPKGGRVLLAGLRSGKDGRPLWFTAEPIPLDRSFLHFRATIGLRPDFSGAVFYWQSAPGIAGHFVVNVTNVDESLAFFFAADTGRLVHVWTGLTDGIADLDGDGLLDLYGHSGGQRVTVRGIPPEVWRRPATWRWRRSSENLFQDRANNKLSYLTGPVPHADLDGDGIADILYFPRPLRSDSDVIQAYSGRDGRLLWEVSGKERENLPSFEWLECLDLEGAKRPVVVGWGDYRGKEYGSKCAVLDGRNGKLRWLKQFPGEARPDLLYRQPGSRLALVYQGDASQGDVLVAVNADGDEVARLPSPGGRGKEAAPLPAGFEYRFPWEAPGAKLLWRFGIEWKRDEERQRMLYPVATDVDPADSAWLRFYSVGDGRLTVLRRGIPSNPATEVPTRSYEGEVVFKRPLPWLERTRAEAKVGVGCVVAYLVLVGILAAVGRRKTALGLLALLILLPAFGAAVGLVLVLAVLAAALPRQDHWWKTAGRFYLIILPGVLLAWYALRNVDLDRALTSAVWTYPAVLVPLCVLALAGWRKTALGLLVPCLVLLLYLNGPRPSDEYFKVLPVTPDGHNQENREPNWYLLNSELLEPANDHGAQHARELLTLYPHETWDWTGWYWLWPNQLASRSGPLAWAFALLAAAELARWLRRNWKTLNEPVNLRYQPQDIAAEHQRRAEQEQQRSQPPAREPP